MMFRSARRLNENYILAVDPDHPYRGRKSVDTSCLHSDYLHECPLVIGIHDFRQVDLMLRFLSGGRENFDSNICREIIHW